MEDKTLELMVSSRLNVENLSKHLACFSVGVEVSLFSLSSKDFSERQSSRHSVTLKARGKDRVKLA